MEWTEVIQGPVACICAHQEKSLGNIFNYYNSNQQMHQILLKSQ